MITLHLRDDLLLHEVDAHGDDAHAQQDVHRPQHQLGVGLCLLHVIVDVVDVGLAGYEVSKADSHQADEAKICPV